MASLVRTLRKELENAVKKARRVAEAGARQAIEQLAVHHHEPWNALSPDQRKLRNRLRAHGRQLGDRLEEGKGTQTINRLVSECAYEHWHRLLFARFLAENDLLVETELGIALSLDECRELSRERGIDWLMLASDFAQRMLPQIFHTGDPVLEVTLPPEKRQELEVILGALSRDVFVANDSLGWVYQFWQAEQKDKVNKSEKKIGADELPAVTQLFTEDYMVLFLLHNTLGAWWAGKVLATRPALAQTATSEDELRKACALPGIDWEYLRFHKSESRGSVPLPEGESSVPLLEQPEAAPTLWKPAAGTFDGWPKAAKDITVLDPCMGSGHFLVFALPILMAFRMAEEGLSQEEAVETVLRDNLFGLEIDPRCTQIAAFNLALAAWKLVGYRALPSLNLACSGLGLNTKKEEWLKLAGNDTRLRQGMTQLYDLFQKAPDLGSLINPRALDTSLFVADFHDLQPLLDKALAQEADDESVHELAVTARGVARAAEILAGQFTLVATNVPYLGRGKQDDVLKDYCERVHSAAKADLATCFVERCLDFCTSGGSTTLVTPQNWLFLGRYKELRKMALTEREWNLVVRLGPYAFETISGERVDVALVALTACQTIDAHALAGLDAGEANTPEGKNTLLRGETGIYLTHQRTQLQNPDFKIALGNASKMELLSKYATAPRGVVSGDSSYWVRIFWELPSLEMFWQPLQSAVNRSELFGGRSNVINWSTNGKGMLRPGLANTSYNKCGVSIAQIGDFPATIYTGELYDNSTFSVVPASPESLLAVWTFCSSTEFNEAVRRFNRKMSVDPSHLVQVPFDLTHWQKVAAEKYPDGLPKPHSDDPTQWLFDGYPVQAKVGTAFGRSGSETLPPHFSHSLQVAVARLLGYRWPRQTGSSFMDCPALGPDGLEKHADDDGIVCLISLKGEQTAADRLRTLLADAFASEWSAAKLNQLLDAVGFGGKSLEDWLRDGFFEQHCELFHQRPFIWHVWDGLRNGFSALVNYHKLCGSSVGAASGRSEQRRDAAATLEKLIYTYLGDWIDRQRADQRAGVEGADARVAAAEYLKRELEKILEGEPPYDLFVRWKPLHEQPLGWEPDINDGVRMNIRPFITAKPLNARGKNACILRVTPKIKWEKDRGKEPNRPKDEYPWFWGWDERTMDFFGSAIFDGNRWNNLHYSRAIKLTVKEQAESGKSGGSVSLPQKEQSDV